MRTRGVLTVGGDLIVILRRRQILALCTLVVQAALVAVAIGVWQRLPQTPQRWSDAATWGGAPPGRDGEVRIAAGKTVVLDVDPPRLASLTVDGRLIVADRDVTLEAKSIVVHGEFIAGSEERRFAHQARIVLDGSLSEAGMLAVSGGGKLTLWGAERRAWTHLAGTAVAGSRSLTLAQAVDWRHGERLVLAPSGFDSNESEEAVVSGVSGSAVTLAKALRFTHWETITNAVDERAEVGLLTHNIVVTSEPGAVSRGVGGQVMVLRGGPTRRKCRRVRVTGYARPRTGGPSGEYFYRAASTDRSCLICQPMPPKLPAARLSISAPPAFVANIQPSQLGF